MFLILMGFYEGLSFLNNFFGPYSVATQIKACKGFAQHSTWQLNFTAKPLNNTYEYL